MPPKKERRRKSDSFLFLVFHSLDGCFCAPYNSSTANPPSFSMTTATIAFHPLSCFDLNA
jgi:hypothetical protein